MPALIDSTLELCQKLTVDIVTSRLQQITGDDHLPGQPRVSLREEELKRYLRKAHLTPELDALSSYLKFIAYPHYAHISSLHHQVTRGRDIIVAESAQLHLVWYYDRIFVKPIPAYLLSAAWWSWIERSDRDVFMAACGFLRSYSCLIQYETDFRRAQKELFLIPEKDDKGPITFEQFAKFIAVFAKCEDDLVSLRYHYGELRLTRLNWLSRLFLRKLTFHHIHAQWSDFLGRALAPTITLFVILSTILSAMQVALAVQAIDEGPESWMPFMKVSRWFSIVVILIVAVLIASVTGVIIFMAVHDQLFARKVIRHKKQPTARGKSLHSGVV